MKKLAIAEWGRIEDRQPVHALVSNVDLVIIRYDDILSVLYGRCAHRGALMFDGYISGKNLICGLHAWDYRYDTGVSEYNNSEYLDKFNAWVEDGDVTLIITGGLRLPMDFVKAIALGAGGVGITTQKNHLRQRLIVDEAAKRLERFFSASTELMQVMARACGHSHLNQFRPDDLTTCRRDMSSLAGIAYAGVAPS